MYILAKIFAVILQDHEGFDEFYLTVTKVLSLVASCTRSYKGSDRILEDLCKIFVKHFKRVQDATRSLLENI